MVTAERISDRNVSHSGEAYALVLDWGMALLHLGKKEGFLNPVDETNPFDKTNPFDENCYLAVRRSRKATGWIAKWSSPKLISLLREPLHSEEPSLIGVQFSLPERNHSLMDEFYSHLESYLKEEMPDLPRETLLRAPFLMGAQLTVEAVKSIKEKGINIKQRLEWVWGQENGKQVTFNARFSDKIRL